MSYANIVAQQAKAVTSFVAINRKRQILYGQLSAGTISFPYGRPVAVTMADGTAGNASRFTAIIPTSDWSYDEDTQVLTLPTSSITDVNGDAFTNITAAIYSVEFTSYFASTPVSFYEDPTLDYTDIVPWKDGVLEVPQVRRSVQDNYAGYTPLEISPIVIAHDGNDLWESLYSDSFLNCAVNVWTCVGSLRAENCQKVFRGRINNLTFTDRSITFEVVEDTRLIDGSYNGRYFSSQAPYGFRSVDPSLDGTPIPIAFGLPRWMRAVNLDYIQDGRTTSDNRVYGVYDIQGLDGGTQNVTLGAVTNLGGNVYSIVMAESEVRKLNIGDYVKRASDGKWAIVTAVTSATVVQFTTSVDPHTPAVTNTYSRPAVQEIYFQVPSDQGKVLNWRIYESSTMSCSSVDDVVTLQLTSGFEAAATALGLTTIDPDDFEVWVRVVGCDQSLPFDTGYIGTPGYAEEITCLYWYLRKIIGLTEDEIDGDAFTTAIASRTPNDVGAAQAYFAHPIWSSDFEDHRTVISRLLQQIGAVGYFNAEGRFTIKARTVLPAADFTLTDSELLDEPDFEIRHDDVSAFMLESGGNMYGNPTSVLKTKPSTFSTVIATTSGTIGEVVSSRYGRSKGVLPVKGVQLYDLNKDTTASGYYLYRLGLRRMATYFGNRKLICKVKASGEILDVEPGDVVELSREYIPGQQHVPGTLQSRKFFVLDVQKIGSFVDIVMEDQYAIEELGSF